MRIIGCDLHARQQAVAMLDTETGELMEMTLTHEGNNGAEECGRCRAMIFPDVVGFFSAGLSCPLAPTERPSNNAKAVIKRNAPIRKVMLALLAKSNSMRRSRSR